ncbi:MAG: F-type H+-transporting ATPase subunit epsilon [Actinomycetota bacterium]|jgi:F-type H+-transporting ATPase subunit epsilon|nr:F-type H+-transporting ATPase subunit epsilon [Actinomycetota bacterium]
MDVQLVSPEQILYQGVGKMVVVRTLGGGDIAFEDNHAPFLGALADWPARVKFEDGSQAWFAVHGGFVEVSNNQVIILSDVAEPAGGIDVGRATDAKTRAEEVLRANAEDDEAAAALARAEVRLQVAASA